MNKKYYEVIKEIEKRISGKKEPDPNIHIQRILSFLEKNNFPENNFKFIHIAGTAGKGTLANYIHKILYDYGENSGLFTSPHIQVAIERIKVGKYFISPQVFVDIYQNVVKNTIKTHGLEEKFGQYSFFEIMLCIGLVYFWKKKCNYIVLETGIGGKYDPTNFIKKPLITIITNIGFDHTEILGNTLSKIAHDKAGIIKKGSVFLTSEKKKNIVSLFSNICKQRGATFIGYNKNNQSVPTGLSKKIYRKIKINNPKIITNLNNFLLPCRFEEIKTKPIFILDGAHNLLKINYLIKKIRMYYPDKKFKVIFACAKDKDAKNMLVKLAEITAKFYFVNIKSRKNIFFNTKELRSIANKYSIESQEFKNSTIAIHAAMKDFPSTPINNTPILATGSFYLTGEIRELFHSSLKILRSRCMD